MIRQKDTWCLIVSFNNERGFAPYPAFFETKRDAQTVGRIISRQFPETGFWWSVEKIKVYDSFARHSDDYPGVVAAEIIGGWDL